MSHTSTPTAIQSVSSKLELLFLIFVFFVVLTWGVVEKYKEVARIGGKAVALRTAMERFVSPPTIILPTFSIADSF